MKMSGTQYYWIIAAALSLQVLLAYPLAKYGDLIESNNLVLAIYLVFFIIVGVCYCTVVLEMWSVFRLKLIGVAVVLFVLSVLIHMSFLFILVLAPHAYWVWRINGIRGKNT
ncbi:hypothetical protein ACIMS1_005298 [Vibrio harveyi]